MQRDLTAGEARTWRRLAALLLLVVAGWAATMPTPAAGAPAAKYYVVAPGEYLYQIALKTLGDGNRYQEIYDLNRERTQPDGGRLTDPTALEPGWVLVLPADARGPGVLDRRPAPPAPSASPAPAASAAATPAAASPPARVQPPARPIWVTTTAMVSAGVAVTVALIAPFLRRGAPTLFADETVPTPAPPNSGEPPAGSGAGSRPPAGPAAGGALFATVRGPAGLLKVRLAAGAPDENGPGYHWLPDGEQPATMGLPAELGVIGPWHLWIDLARVPDIFTLVGEPARSRAHGRALADRMAAAGVRVIVVGDVLGDDLPAAWIHLTAFPVADSTGLSGVVFSAGLRGDELVEARRMVAATGGGVVPVLVGRTVPARWSASSQDAPA